MKVGSRSFALLLCLIGVCSIAGQTAKGRSLTVISEPNAAVWINGVRYGSTGPGGKLTISSAPAGRLNVRVRADGFAEVTRSLLPAQKGEIAIPLNRSDDEAWLDFQEGERQSATDRKKAAEAYRKAIKLNPKLTAAHIGLARVLSDGGDQEAALTAIKALRRISPRNAEASAIEGRIHKELGDEQKAIASFRRAVTEAGGFQPEAYAGLGLLYKEKAEAAGDPEDPEAVSATTEAAKNLSMAVKQLGSAPDAMVIMQLLGLVYEKQKRYKEAIAVYEDFLRVFPDSNESEAVRSFIVQIKKQLEQQ